MAVIFRGEMAIFTDFYVKITIFPLKMAAIMEILKISKIASVKFFASYFYTFWPKISFLAQFLEEWIHFVRSRRKTHLKFRSYGLTLIFPKLQIEISRERIKIFQFRKKLLSHE